MSTQTGRLIGVSHRVKATAAGEARPTLVAIRTPNGKYFELELASEQDELDFVFGRFPAAYRDMTNDDKVDGVPPNHIIWRKLRKNENVDDFAPHRRRSTAPKSTEYMVAVKIATRVEGLTSGDTVAMMLGGSGDYLAYAFVNRGRMVGASVIRIPPHTLKRERGEKIIGRETLAEVFDGWKDIRDRAAELSENPTAPPRKSRRTKKKEEETEGGVTTSPPSPQPTFADHYLLAHLAHTRPELFYKVEERDRGLILVRELWRLLEDVMKDRVACQQRLWQRFIGEIFTHPDGIYPDGGIEKAFDERKASDAILKALMKREAEIERALIRALESLPVYQKLLKPISGVGPRIAARIFAAIVDIRRFKTDSQLAAFMGVHILSDGRFPRKRTGEVANWHNDGRQAMVLLADQFNRRPDSPWGMWLLGVKSKLRKIHPEPEGKKWSTMHIHKTALWRTSTHFVKWLHEAWWDLDHPGEMTKRPIPGGRWTFSLRHRLNRHIEAILGRPAPVLPGDENFRQQLAAE